MQEIKLKDNHVLRIETCDFNESPREDCNVTQMIFFGNHSHLGDEHDFSSDMANNWEELEQVIQKQTKAVHIQKIYGYSHSGLTISTSPFSCRWDSGVLGFCIITKEDIRNIFGVKRVTQKDIDKAIEQIEGEVKVLDQYISGEIYQFELVKINTCECCEETSEEHIDSCGGFYGSDIEENGMLEYIAEEFHAEILEAV